MPFMSVETILVTGGTTSISSTDIESVAKNSLSGNYWHLFSKKNIFLYSKKRIIENLLTQFQSLRSVDISTVDFQTIEVTIAERKISALWCVGDGVTTLKNNSCYFTDDQGYVFDPAPEFSSGAFFRLYGVLGENPLGRSYIEPVNYAQILSFRDRLETVGIRVNGLLTLPDNDYHLLLDTSVASSTSTSFIAIPHTFESTSLYNDLMVVLDQSELKSHRTKSGHIVGVDYIDLRFHNKVFYKLSK